jgi:hypothetical protein
MRSAIKAKKIVIAESIAAEVMCNEVCSSSTNP